MDDSIDGIVRKAFVLFGPVRLEPVERSAKQLKVKVPADQLAQARTVVVQVVNPDPTGESRAWPREFQINNPKAEITDADPKTVVAGSGPIRLRVIGRGFVTGSTVRWEGLDRPTEREGGGALVATILESDLASPKTATVRVLNPSPGGGESNALSVRVTPKDPAPRITAVTPNPIRPRSGLLTVRVDGSGFKPGAEMYWRVPGNVRPSTIDGSGTFLTATLQPGDTADDFTPARIHVRNPDGQTTEFDVRISNPKPSISSLNPRSVTAGSPAVQIQVNGTQFADGATVLWNGSQRDTGRQSETVLVFTLSPDDIAAPTSGQVTVVNPDPSDGASEAHSLGVERPSPKPRITSVDPPFKSAGSGAFTLTVSGLNFFPLSKVHWNGSEKKTDFGDGVLYAAIAASDLAVSGTATVTVVNPPELGGTSEAEPFTILNPGENPTPQVSRISPNTAKVGGAGFTLVVSGSGFVSGSKVRWNGVDRVPQFVSDQELRVAVDLSDLKAAGAVRLSVFNPAPRGGLSNIETLAVSGAPKLPPAILSIDPTSARAGGGDVRFRVNGTNLTGETKVRWNGFERTTSFLNPTQLEALIPASDLATVGEAAVTLIEPSMGGRASDARTFTVCSGLCLTSVSPDRAAAGAASFTLTLHGTGFGKDSRILWNGSELPTTFVSENTLRAGVAAGEIAVAKTAAITVANPSGEASNARTFTVEPKTVPVHTLFYPRLSTRTDTSLPGDDSEATGIAVVNLSATAASLRLTAFDASGSPSSDLHLSNPATIKLAPGEQLTHLDTQIFGSALERRSTQGWLKLESDNKGVVGFFLMFNNSLTVLDGADVSSRALTSFVVPEVDAGFTEIHLHNPGDEAASATLELIRSDGTARTASISRKIAANGGLVESLATLFADVIFASSDYLRVTSDRGLVGFAALGPQGVRAMGVNAQDAAGGAATLYSPQYIAGGDAFRSDLSIVNLDAFSGTVTLKFYKDDGTLVGASRELQIAARGKLHVTDPEFFAKLGAIQTEGYLVITSSRPKLTGSVVFSDPARAAFSAALPLVSELQSAVVFGQIASDGTYFTGVSVLNPSDAAVNAAFEVFDGAGDLVAHKVEEIEARRRTSDLVTELFPELEGKDIRSGYIRMTTDRPVAAFALYGTGDLSVLAAVMPQVVP